MKDYYIWGMCHTCRKTLSVLNGCFGPCSYVCRECVEINEDRDVKKKQLIRQAFRKAVWDRDGIQCKFCGSQPDEEHRAYPVCEYFLDVHHITDRNEMPNGGYVAENGISLCGNCHIMAEEHHAHQGREKLEKYSPEALYKLIGSSKEKAVKASEEL